MIRDGYYAKAVNHLWRDMPRSVDHCLRLYLWFINATTEEEEGEDGRMYGIVNYGNPVKMKDIGADIHRGWSALQRQVDILAEHGYILRKQETDHSAYSYRVAESYKFNKLEEMLRLTDDVDELPVAPTKPSVVPKPTVLTSAELAILTEQAMTLARKFENEVIGFKLRPGDFKIAMLKIREYLMDKPVFKSKKLEAEFPVNHQKVTADFIGNQMDAVRAAWGSQYNPASDELKYFLEHLFDKEERVTEVPGAPVGKPGEKELIEQAAALAGDFNKMFMSGKGNKSDLSSWSMFIREYLDGTAEGLEREISLGTMRQIMRSALSNNWKSRVSTAANPIEYFLARIYGAENGKCLGEAVEDEIEDFEPEDYGDEPDGETFDSEEEYTQ